MARKAIVTRTVVGTEVSVMAVDCLHGEVVNKTYVLSGKYKDGTALLKAVQKAYDNEGIKHVQVVSEKPVNQIYGMWEEDFIAAAMKLDADRKPIDDVEGETAEA